MCACMYVGKTTLVTALPFHPPRRGGGGRFYIQTSMVDLHVCVTSSSRLYSDTCTIVRLPLQHDHVCTCAPPSPRMYTYILYPGYNDICVCFTKLGTPPYHVHGAFMIPSVLYSARFRYCAVIIVACPHSIVYVHNNDYRTCSTYTMYCSISYSAPLVSLLHVYTILVRVPICHTSSLYRDYICQERIFYAFLICIQCCKCPPSIPH